MSDGALFGPLQLVLIGFGKATVPMDFVNQLRQVRDDGIVRIVDAVFVSKDDNGDLISIEATDLSDEEIILFGTLSRALFGYGIAGDEGAQLGIDAGLARGESGDFGLSESNIVEISDSIEPGTAALFILLEHAWAIGLKDAVANADGEVLAQGFITPTTLVALGQAVAAEAASES